MNGNRRKMKFSRKFNIDIPDTKLLLSYNFIDTSYKKHKGKKLRGSIYFK